MSYADLMAALRQLHPAIYETAAPHGLTRYAVVSRYGASHHRGDDVNILDFPRLQIDVYVQDPEDPLPGQICALLTACYLPYDNVGMSYDDDLALWRTVLQTEVMAW